MPEHDAAPLGERHPLHNWEYANAAARLAATGFIPADVTKWAKQLDDGTYWELTDDSPIVWVQHTGISDDSVTNAKLANVAQSTVKGRAAGSGTGDPVDLLPTQVRSILLEMQRWNFNFTANGDAYIAADVAMTIDVGVAAIGTGTLAYEKSTAVAPSTFSSTSLPAALEAGAWLKVSVSGISVFKAVELKRTA